MMRRGAPVLSDLRGAAAIEFALVAPAFVALLVAIGQLGILFFASAGLSNALAEGARLATLHPRPSTAQIKSKINAAKFGLVAKNLATPILTPGKSGSSDYYNIQMSYTVDLELFFVDLPPITLQQSRRVYLQTLPGT
ncbi:MAG: pilus assembly protein [Sphingosinicella sp.]|nr:pilus assembly protein [Sphingosinicella sp.]